MKNEQSLKDNYIDYFEKYVIFTHLIEKKELIPTVNQ
jgi:hypothetical protein